MAVPKKKRLAQLKGRWKGLFTSLITLSQRRNSNRAFMYGHNNSTVRSATTLLHANSIFSWNRCFYGIKRNNLRRCSYLFGAQSWSQSAVSVGALLYRSRRMSMFYSYQYQFSLWGRSIKSSTLGQQYNTTSPRTHVNCDNLLSVCLLNACQTSAGRYLHFFLYLSQGNLSYIFNMYCMLYVFSLLISSCNTMLFLPHLPTIQHSPRYRAVNSHLLFDTHKPLSTISTSSVAARVTSAYSTYTKLGLFLNHGIFLRRNLDTTHVAKYVCDASAYGTSVFSNKLGAQNTNTTHFFGRPTTGGVTAPHSAISYYTSKSFLALPLFLIARSFQYINLTRPYDVVFARLTSYNIYWDARGTFRELYLSSIKTKTRVYKQSVSFGLSKLASRRLALPSRFSTASTYFFSQNTVSAYTRRYMRGAVSTLIAQLRRGFTYKHHDFITQDWFPISRALKHYRRCSHKIRKFPSQLRFSRRKHYVEPRRRHFTEWGSLPKLYVRLEPVHMLLLQIKGACLRRGPVLTYFKKLRNICGSSRFVSALDTHRLLLGGQPRSYRLKLQPPHPIDVPLPYWLADTNTIVGLPWYGNILHVLDKYDYQYQSVFYYINYMQYCRECLQLQQLLRWSTIEDHKDAYGLFSYLAAGANTPRGLYFANRNNFFDYLNGFVCGSNSSNTVFNARRCFVLVNSCLTFSSFFFSYANVRLNSHHAVDSISACKLHQFLFWKLNHQATQTLQYLYLHLLSTYHIYLPPHTRRGSRQRRIGRTTQTTTWLSSLLFRCYTLRPFNTWMFGKSKFPARRILCQAPVTLYTSRPEAWRLYVTSKLWCLPRIKSVNSISQLILQKFSALSVVLQQPVISGTDALLSPNSSGKFTRFSNDCLYLLDYVEDSIHSFTTSIWNDITGVSKAVKLHNLSIGHVSVYLERSQSHNHVNRTSMHTNCLYNLPQLFALTELFSYKNKQLRNISWTYDIAIATFTACCYNDYVKQFAGVFKHLFYKASSAHNTHLSIGNSRLHTLDVAIKQPVLYDYKLTSSAAVSRGQLNYSCYAKQRIFFYDIVASALSNKRSWVVCRTQVAASYTVGRMWSVRNLYNHIYNDYICFSVITNFINNLFVTLSDETHVPLIGYAKALPAASTVNVLAGCLPASNNCRVASKTSTMSVFSAHYNVSSVFTTSALTPLITSTLYKKHMRLRKSYRILKKAYNISKLSKLLTVPTTTIRLRDCAVKINSFLQRRRFIAVPVTNIIANKSCNLTILQQARNTLSRLAKLRLKGSVPYSYMLHIKPTKITKLARVNVRPYRQHNKLLYLLKSFMLLLLRCGNSITSHVVTVLTLPVLGRNTLARVLRVKRPTNAVVTSAQSWPTSLRLLHKTHVLPSHSISYCIWRNFFTFACSMQYIDNKLIVYAQRAVFKNFNNLDALFDTTLLRNYVFFHKSIISAPCMQSCMRGTVTV